MWLRKGGSESRQRRESSYGKVDRDMARPKDVRYNRVEKVVMTGLAEHYGRVERGMAE